MRRRAPDEEHAGTGADECCRGLSSDPAGRPGEGDACVAWIHVVPPGVIAASPATAGNGKLRNTSAYSRKNALAAWTIGFLVAGIVDPVHQVGEVRDVLLVEGAVRAQIREGARSGRPSVFWILSAASSASDTLVPSSTCTMPKKPIGLRRAIVS